MPDNVHIADSHLLQQRHPRLISLSYPRKPNMMTSPWTSNVRLLPLHVNIILHKLMTHQQSIPTIPLLREAKGKAKAKAKAKNAHETDSPPPNYLNRDAATVLMGVLYAARMARPDLLRATQALASALHSWTRDCDQQLYRLMCYVSHTLHHRQICWIGDSFNDLGPGCSADANFAGCPRTLRSTSGAHVAIEGPNTLFSIAGCSARQTRTCNCTAESELM